MAWSQPGNPETSKALGWFRDIRVGLACTEHTSPLCAPILISRNTSNVLIYTGGPPDLRPSLAFGHFSIHGAQPYSVSLVSAYFSTYSGAVVRVTAYDGNEAVVSVLIGGDSQSWNNKLVEISSPGKTFHELIFEGVNSPEDILHFCMDDMSVTPIPEPSSLLALLAGLGGFGGMIWRRRAR